MESYFEDDENVYFVLEDANEGSLKEYMTEPRDPVQVKRLLTEVFEAVEIIHWEKITHGDLRLSNILL